MLLFFSFCLSLIALAIGPLFFPLFQIFAFAPYLVSFFQKKDLLSSGLIALCCGCISDLLSTSSPFGLFTATYFFSSLFVYPIRRYFFENRLWTLSLYTFLFSIVLSLLYACFAKVATGLSCPSFSQMLLSSFFAPFIDALYAFLWFTIPQKFYSLIVKVFTRFG